jgi:hypothetical protein
MCKFPNCSRNPQPNGYCIGHQGYASFTQAKPVKNVSKKSDTRKEDEREYKKIVKQMMAVSDKCEINSPDCTHIAQGLHHMKKRGAEYLNKKYLKRSCNACNRYCENHPKWAIVNGHSVSKFKPEENRDKIVIDPYVEKKEPDVIIAEMDNELNAIIIK